MNRLWISAATGAVFLLGSAAALAQDRGGNRDGWRGGGDRGYRSGASQRGGGDQVGRGETYRGGGGRDWHRGDNRQHWRGDRYSGRYGHRGDYPRYGYYPRYGWAPRYSWSSPYRYGYRHPGWLYAAPVLPLISYPYWEQPVYVERIVEREPVYVERIVEREPVYVERVEEPREYAQAAPPTTRQPVEPARPAPAPPPRLERYTLSATELFEFDQAVLRMPQPKLDEIANALRRNPGIDNVTITGHTDRLGSDAYNQKLSQRRADAVKSYLVRKGVEARRLEAIGKGESNPVVQCDDKDRAALIRCLEPNRRVEVEQITIESRR